MDIISTNLNLYKYFVTVMEEGGISRAAKRMAVTQPTVSYGIRELEKDLDERLFEVAERGVTPTDAAIELYRNIKPLYLGFLSIQEKARRGGSKKRQAVVRIGITTAEMNRNIAEFIYDFETKYPSVSVNIVNAQRQELRRMLSLGGNEGIDLCIHSFTNRTLELHREKNSIRHHEMIKRMKYSLVYKKGEDPDNLPFMCARSSLNEEIYDRLLLNKKELLRNTAPEAIMEFVKLGKVKSIFLNEFIEKYSYNLEKAKIDGPDYYLCIVYSYDKMSRAAGTLYKELKKYFNV
jgi:hypothetical protein